MKVHFLGIGGIGVSALARYYLAKGHRVSGSDLVASEITDALKKKGVEVSIGENKIPQNADLIIYSPAVKAERLKSKIPTLSYPQALGELTKKYFTIAVSGTHGKSTTTAMIGILLAKAGLDPTVVVGTKVKEFGNSNCRIGKSRYLVIEADEHMASFLNYWPKAIVLTTLEEDHLDYYKNLNNILKTFKEYVGHLPKNGWLVANKDDKNIREVLKAKTSILSTYSLKQVEAEKLRKIMKIPGEHNVSNALASLAIARILKIPDEVSLKSLSEYRGSWRRFEVHQSKLDNKPITVISDYGHHPTEIRVTLKATREKYGQRKIWCVFQPHQYQRTYYLLKDFVKTFRESPVDKLIITDIYDVAGRETPELKKKVSAERLVLTVNKKWVNYVPKSEILDYLRKNLRGREVVVVMGAGDIYDLTLKLVK